MTGSLEGCGESRIERDLVGVDVDVEDGFRFCWSLNVVCECWTVSVMNLSADNLFAFFELFISYFASYYLFSSLSYFHFFLY